MAASELAHFDFRRDALLFDKIAVPMLGWEIRNIRFTKSDDAEAMMWADELA